MAWFKVAELSVLKPDKGFVVVLDRRRIALFLTDGVVGAIDDTCPHRGGSLSEGQVFDRHVECPLHGWAFDVCSGTMRGTAGVRVARYPVEIRDGAVWLDFP